MFREELLQDGVSSDQIIAINFEDMDYSDLLDSKKVYNYIKERLSNRRTYIFLDEIQLVDEFERV